MPVTVPKQITTFQPFTPRLWATLLRDYVVLNPELDIRDGEDTTQTFSRYLKGENVIFEEILNFDSTTSSTMPTSRVVRDADHVDSGLQVTKASATTLSISPGAFLLMNIYVEFTEASTFDISDVSNFTSINGDPPIAAEPDKSYYLSVMPSFLLTEADPGICLIMIDATSFDDVVSVYPSFANLGCLLAVVTTNGSGQIQNNNSITYTRSDVWDREALAYPQSPSLNPLNGGVVRDGDWFDDWT